MSLTAAQREQLFKSGIGHGGGGGTVLRAHSYMADQYKQVCAVLLTAPAALDLPDCWFWDFFWDAGDVDY
jgi:hypothetical protein